MCVVSARTEKCVVLTKAVAGCVWTGTELGIYARSSTVYLWMELFHITEVGFEFCIDFVDGSIYSSLFSLGCWGFCYPFDCSFLVRRLLLPLRFLNGYFKLYLSELIMSMWYKDLEIQVMEVLPFILPCSYPPFILCLPQTSFQCLSPITTPDFTFGVFHDSDHGSYV